MSGSDKSFLIVDTMLVLETERFAGLGDAAVNEVYLGFEDSSVCLCLS